MTYKIESIDLYVRETPPGRMLFLLGTQTRSTVSKQDRINPLGHVRMVVKNSNGETFGCSGDRLSVRWLDKRPGRDKSLKLRELVDLIHFARDAYLAAPEFESPFEQWRRMHPKIMEAGRKSGQEALTSSFASALMERAMLDAVCRLEDQPIFEMVKQNRLGFEPGRVHKRLGEMQLAEFLPDRPMTQFSLRHTVGLADPLSNEELPNESRVNDGLPETLEEYIRDDGIRHFKIKISGNVDADFDRLRRIWDLVLAADQPVITLDANESYSDLASFEKLVNRLDQELTGLFQHILYIEQPLPRRTTLDRSTTDIIRRISQRKPLLIDEADGTVDAYSQAREIGYEGTSHKNCKGFFKSLLNYALVMHHSLQDENAFLSAEDLQNLPVVPLHQDFATLGILGIDHCERNGHHYNYGLSMLSDRDKQNVIAHHPDMYVQRGDESFLRIDNGAVRCDSLQCAGFGIRDEPDWESMTPLKEWINSRHPSNNARR